MKTSTVSLAAFFYILAMLLALSLATPAVTDENPTLQPRDNPSYLAEILNIMGPEDHIPGKETYVSPITILICSRFC